MLVPNSMLQSQRAEACQNNTLDKREHRHVAVLPGKAAKLIFPMPSLRTSDVKSGPKCSNAGMGHLAYNAEVIIEQTHYQALQTS